MQLRYFTILCGLVIAVAAAVPISTSPAPSPPSTAEFDFAISVSPSEIECLERDMCSSMVTVSAQSINSTQPVSLTISGLRGGFKGEDLKPLTFWNYLFDPATGVPPFTSKLIIKVPEVDSGKYELTISGSGGGRVHSTTLTLMIKLQPSEDLVD